MMERHAERQKGEQRQTEEELAQRLVARLAEYPTISYAGGKIFTEKI